MLLPVLPVLPAPPGSVRSQEMLFYCSNLPWRRRSCFKFKAGCFTQKSFTGCIFVPPAAAEWEADGSRRDKVGRGLPEDGEGKKVFHNVLNCREHLSPHAVCLSVCQSVAVIHSLLTELLPKTTEFLQPNPGTDKRNLWAFSPPFWLLNWSQFRVIGAPLGDVMVFSTLLRGA